MLKSHACVKFCSVGICGSPLDGICDDRLKTSRRHMRSRNQNRQDIIKRSTILIDDLIDDSISYCACVIVRISEDFYDDRHENCLVEIRLTTLLDNVLVSVNVSCVLR